MDANLLKQEGRILNKKIRTLKEALEEYEKERKWFITLGGNPKFYDDEREKLVKSYLGGKE